METAAEKQAPRFTVSVNPAVLRWARERLALPVEYAAHRIGREPGVLEAWEEGREDPTWAALRELSHIYRLPVAGLLLPEPPADTKPPDRRTFGEPPPLTSRTYLRLEEARRLRAVAADVFRSLGAEPNVSRPSQTELSQLEELVADQRQRLGVRTFEQARWGDEWEALRRWRIAVESLNVLVLQFRMPREEVRGFSMSDGDDPPVIVVNSEEDPPPRIFTLFHEFAHVLLGSSGICLPDPKRASRRARQEIESFCNEFAGEFLLPKIFLEEEVDAAQFERWPPTDADLDTIAHRYKVSRQVVWVRLHRSGRLEDDDYSARWAQWAARSKKRKEAERPQQWGPKPAERAVYERGVGFVSALFEAHGRGSVTTPELADYLGVKVNDLRETAVWVRRQSR